MCEKARKRLIDSVIALSDADDWDEARTEWKVIDCYDAGAPSEHCVCGQENLRYQFTIENVKNGNTLYPIGSTCVEKFGVSEMDEEQRCWREAINLMNEAARLGRGKYVPLDAKFYSRALLRFLYEQGALSAFDYMFMLDTFNAHSRTDEQEENIDIIMHDSIYPFLRKLYRRVRLKKS